MRSKLPTVAMIAIVAGAARADVLVLRSGETVEGTVVAELGDETMIRLADGSSRKVKTADIASRTKSDPKKVERGKESAPAQPAARNGHAAESRTRTIRAVAQTALPVSESWSPVTARPIEANGKYVMTEKEERVALATAPVYDDFADDVLAKELSEATADSRYRGIKALAGAFVLLHAEVESVQLNRGYTGDLDVVVKIVDSKLFASLRAGTGRTVPFPEKESWKVGTKLTIPVLLVVQTAAGNQFLGGSHGHPFTVHPVVADVGSPDPAERATAPTKPSKASPDAEQQKALLTRVKGWILARKNMRCASCRGEQWLGSGKDRRRCQDCSGGIAPGEADKVEKKYGDYVGLFAELRESTIDLKVCGDEAIVGMEVRVEGTDRWLTQRTLWRLVDGQWRVQRGL